MGFIVYDGLKIFYKFEDHEAYPPSEDTFLLAKWVEKLANGVVLDMCTGSGILGLIAARKTNVTKVYLCDIDKDAIKIARYNAKINKLDNKVYFILSDLFSCFSQVKFDTIIFNPPYLPEEGKEDRKTRLWTVGGKIGNEIIIRFLTNAKRYLNKNGKILMVFSSLSNKHQINNTLANLNFEFIELDRNKLFFEELYVYLIHLSIPHNP